MSDSVSSGDAPIPRVTAAAIAANLRVLSVRLDEKGPEQSVELLGRVNQIVELFVEKHWRAPRRSARIRPLSFLLFPAPGDPTFHDDVEALTHQLERHLFGEGVEIKCLIGDAAGIEEIAAAPEETFVAAHAAREPEHKGSVEEEEAAAPARLLTDREQALGGQMRLFAGYDAPKSAVLCYIASLGVGEPTAPASYDEVQRHAGVRAEVFEFAALRFVAEKIADRIRTGAVGYCLTPLSYETLADRKRREAYLAVAAELPEGHRRFILPSIFGGPASPATNFLLEIVGALRQSFANIDWQTPTCAIHLEPLKDAGVFAITLAPPKAAWERKIELARLPALVRRLSALRIRAGVAGLATLAEVEEAVAARAHYLSGPAVSTQMPNLAPRLKLPLAELPLAAAA